MFSLFKPNSKTLDESAKEYAESVPLPPKIDQEIINNLVLNGDLSQMSPNQKTDYYNAFCNSLGLNPLTQPFKLLKLSGKLVLYATKDATEQLRKIYSVSITNVEAKELKGVYVVTANAIDGKGRTDASTGVVSISNLAGDSLANAIMKAETKAKRRVTLSICGLGMLDETEIETIPNAQTVETNYTIEPEKSAAKKTAAPKKPAKTIAELHLEFMDLYAELSELIGESACQGYHPDNWKTEKSADSYQYGIKALKDKLKEVKTKTQAQ